MNVCILAAVSIILTLVFAGDACPRETGHVPFCKPIDLSHVHPDGSEAAGKRVLGLNTGDPRTVRVIHFVPSDRPFRAVVEDSIKRAVRRVQAFFKDQMRAHGYGTGSLNIETDDAGEPLIHRVTGRHPDDHYSRDAHSIVYREIREEFDTHENVFLTFIDNSRGVIASGGRRGKVGGEASVGGDFKWNTVAHELGHTFGLHHDFRDDRYVMSYGEAQDSLAVVAARFLSVHPYFNSQISIDQGASPIVELISSRKFQPNAENISAQFEATDTDGLHQLILFTTTPPLHWGSGYPEVKAWRDLEKKQNSMVELEYRRDIVSTTATPANPAPEEIHVTAVDTDGNVGQRSFNLVSVSPYHHSSLEGHRHWVFSVLFSPDGKFLASGSDDNTIRLWDVATGMSLATLLHAHAVSSMSFSPDGSTLASGSWDGKVQFWDVATGERLTTLQGSGSVVRSVAFSPAVPPLLFGHPMGISGCGTLKQERTPHHSRDILPGTCRDSPRRRCCSP